MIQKYVADLARQMQIPLSSVTIVDDSSIKNLDSRLLKISSGEHTSFVLLQQKDLDGFQSADCDLPKTTVQTAMVRLLMQIEL